MGLRGGLQKHTFCVLTIEHRRCIPTGINLVPVPLSPLTYRRAPGSSPTPSSSPYDEVRASYPLAAFVTRKNRDRLHGRRPVPR